METIIEVLKVLVSLVALYWAFKLILTVLIVLYYKGTGRMEKLALAISLRETVGYKKFRDILKK
ncbi:hypothetical protein H8D85_00460 [bacterium]|nr:hypothetical protein [bacterium]